MTPKLEQAAREVIRQHSMECLSDKAVDALREALAEQVHTPYCKQAPMCKTPCGNSDCVEQAEQEPVGEVVLERMGAGDAQIVRFQMYGKIPPVGTKLYAAPVRTKDLTDSEIADIGTNCGTSMWSLMFARAVIAADREKNK